MMPRSDIQLIIVTKSYVLNHPFIYYSWNQSSEHAVLIATFARY